MTQKYLLAFLAGVLLFLPSIAQTTLKFTDYPVSEIYTGKHAKALGNLIPFMATCRLCSELGLTKLPDWVV